MSAALRSVARRLGRGSLLQRTQAEEPRQLFSPSRSRLLHTGEHARADLKHEIHQKRHELRNLEYKAMQKKKELYDALGKANKNYEPLADDMLPLALQQLYRRQVVPKQHTTLGTLMWFARRANALLGAAANVTIMVLATVFAFGDRVSRGVKAQTVNEENEGRQD